MSMIEEVAAMKQEQKAQWGDLVHINNNISPAGHYCSHSEPVG